MDAVSLPKVYLAGPITGLSFGEATDWREAAITRLGVHGILGLSPLRAKDYLLAETTLADEYVDKVLSCQKGITTRDRFDCQRADILLVNLAGAERVSIGTMIELGWADSVRVPIILVLEPGSPHDHAMVREVAGWIVPNLQEALDVAIAVLGGE